MKIDVAFQLFYVVLDSEWDVYLLEFLSINNRSFFSFTVEEKKLIDLNVLFLEVV